MKRLIVVLALLLVLPVFFSTPAIAADIDDPRVVGDDHPWGGEDTDPGRYRHINSSEEYASTGYLAIDLLIYQDAIISRLKSIITRPDKVKTLDANRYVPDTQTNLNKQTSAK